MELGRTYKQRWMILGYVRYAYFIPLKNGKQGQAIGPYVDADGKHYKRFSVPFKRFGEWSRAD